MIHRDLLRLVGDLRGGVARVAALMCLVYAGYVGQAVLVASGLGALVRRDVATAVELLVAALLVVVLRTALMRVRDLAVADLGARARATLRARILASLESSAAQLRGRRAGQVLTAAVDGVEGMDAYVGRYLPQLAATVVASPLILLPVAVRAPEIAAVALACVVGVLVVPRISDRRLLTDGVRRWEAHESLGTDFLETIQGMTTLRVLGAVERQRETFTGRTSALLDTTVRQLRTSLRELGVSALLLQSGTVVTALLVAASTLRGDLAARDAFLVLLVVAEAFRPSRDLAGAWHAGYLGLTGEPAITAALADRGGVRFSGSADLPGDGPIGAELQHLCLTHPGRRSRAVDDVTLTLAPGSVTAIAGHSGAGKSTLGNLLTRALDPDGGTITLRRGHHSAQLADLGRDALHAGVATVGQDTYLFADTVLANIALSDEVPDRARARAAAEQAGAHGFVSGLPDGYDTVLGERGTGLSGGQRQRLSLARALYQQPGLLVLDEPTSHLDEAAESVVIDAIASLRGRCTVVVIAHRPATVLAADTVAVLRDGRLVELGDPRRLHGSDSELTAVIGGAA